MEKDIEQLVLEAKPLFEQGKLSIDNIINLWLETAHLYRLFKDQNVDMIELIKKQNEVIEQLTHALLVQKSNFHV